MKSFFLFILLFLISMGIQAKRVELIFWHAMAGQLGEEVQHLTEQFNQSQNEFIIKPVYKGNYRETFTSFAAAFRAHQAPAMVQIFEVGTSIMLAPKGIIKPVDDLMREQNITFAKSDFVPSIVNFYSREGKLMAMPFNVSTPVLFYNRDVLTKLGYSQATFPQNWDQMEALARKLKHAGYHCTYTSAYSGWILFESFAAIHGLSLTDGNPVHAVFNTSTFLKHFARLKRWNDLGYFRYGGRGDDATILFTSNVCPLFSQSSGAYKSLHNLVPFNLGVAVLPLDTSISPKRHANVAGGAALWAVAGQSSLEYKGIALFFAFITSPQAQKHWQEHTGYLAIGNKGQYLNQGNEDHLLLIAQNDLLDSFGVSTFNYFGPQNQIRAIADEGLEAMFANLVTPEQALKQITSRVNHILKRFDKNTR